jgi:hypothetical protein
MVVVPEYLTPVIPKVTIRRGPEAVLFTSHPHNPFPYETFEGLKAMRMKMIVLWDVTPCNLVDR